MNYVYFISETPLWLLVHVAPIKSNSDAVVLILLLFKDITLLKQLIPEQNDKGMNAPSNFCSVRWSQTHTEKTYKTFVPDLLFTYITQQKLGS